MVMSWSRRSAACTVDFKANIDGESRLGSTVQNRTQCPTEVRPFGGAATCIGGAIRSYCQASYVYATMRVSGRRESAHAQV